MRFRDITTIKREYRSYRNSVVTEFYTPVLKEAVLYKRAVGFFSSTALIELSKGISGLIRNGGKIKFIVSPILQEDDIEAISKGYNLKDIVENCIVREFYEPKTKTDEERLNWLATLISTGSMDIKVAFTESNLSTGMYHEKMGILYDSEYNKIAFSGSMNETINAFINNYESIDVYCSWEEADRKRVEDKETAFDILWNNKERKINVIDFPKAAREKLMAYKKESINLEIDNEFNEKQKVENIRSNIPLVPSGVELHPYQNEAIAKWKDIGYRGIFDMATGTGKTYTGLGAAATLFSDKKKVAIIIAAPYQHLVEQWVEDILKFNLKPIIGYAASKQKDWKQRLAADVLDFKIGVINCFCFVTTNATFSSKYVQNQLNKLGKDTLLIVDEAHNFGAYNLSKTLNPRIEYRLALSATLERHGDKEGTQLLYNYFGGKCIEYGLERAIREDKLTPYYYHPKVVYLTEDELEHYRELSRKIMKQCHRKADGKVEVSELGKKLLIERARLVAGASNKVALLRELMEDYKNDSHILVYCGATKYYDPNSDSSSRDEEEERQIVAVSKMLGHDLKMKVTHFTSAESAAERELIKRKFSEANPYQAIVAIKCLDEGVNIPSIKTAFILASSTNPKEYVQRRGRVLRKAENKPFARIYDFITLPRPINRVSIGSETARMDTSLIKKEIARMMEFGEISKNPSEADKLIKELNEAYGFDLINEEGNTYV